MAESDRTLGRYRDLGSIGRGAFGEVRRVHDASLQRSMAMKIFDRTGDPGDEALACFVDEARLMARLQHPGIVPVHEIGRLPDGRAYFTMKEVHGRTFADVIDRVHAAVVQWTWRPTADGWTFRRLVDAFRSACQTVAFAHDAGVLHLDLKPENIQVGGFGEVLVLDWGLARLSSGGAPDSERADDTGITGTLAYMPPEQLRDGPPAATPRSDVYALGATLFHLMTGGPPVQGGSFSEIRQRVLSGHSPQLVGPAPLPAELASCCRRAMQRDPADRFPDARALAAAVEAWIDQAWRVDQAERVLADARRVRAEIARLDRDLSEAEVAAVDAAKRIERHDPLPLKLGAWAREDHAASLSRRRSLAEAALVQSLGAALRLADVADAHQMLADVHRGRHERAERDGAPELAAEQELLLRTHDHRGLHARYLRGLAAVTLHTDPAGAEAVLFRWVERERTLVPEYVRHLGKTPISAESIPHGDYLIVLDHPGCRPVRYPIAVGRGAHWDGVRPGGRDPLVIAMSGPDVLGPDECYVPAGWFRSGGDPGAVDGHEPRRLWVDGFAVGRFPVTHGAYLAFLDALVADGREDEARRRVPRVEGGEARVRRIGGRFEAVGPDDGSWAGPDTPITGIDWHDATAWAAWRGLRLLHDAEWEKAARGVNGRLFPWGNYYDPCFCANMGSFGSRPHLPPVHAFHRDLSVYGVRGLAGHVRDWCSSGYRRDGVAGPVVRLGQVAGTHRMIRGGCWADLQARCANRFASLPSRVMPVVGFRVGRSVGRVDAQES